MKISDALKSSPWNNGDGNGLTRSNVDYQDDAKGLKETIKDIKGGNINSLLAIGKSQLNQTAIASSSKNIFNAVTSKFTTKEDKVSERPKGTVTNKNDELEVQLKALREDINKQSVLETKFGQYASMETLLGSTFGLFVGTLGMSPVANVANSILGSSFDGLGLSTIIDKIAKNSTADKDSLKTWENASLGELGLLTVANKYTIENSAKPSLEIKSPNKRYNLITTDAEAEEEYNLTGYTKNSDEDEFAKNNNWRFSKQESQLELSDGKNYYLTGGYIGQDGKLFYKDLKEEDKNSGTFVYSKDIVNVSDENNGLRKDKENCRIVSLKRPEIIISNRIIKEQDGLQYFAEISNINEYEPIHSRVTKSEIFNRVNNTFREIGGLYVEPYYSNGVLNCFEIPFEFNPNISEGSAQAKYQVEELLSRMLPIRSYIGNDAGELTIETTYLSTTNYDEDKKTDGWLNGWMSDWTPQKIKQIERQLRSLTLPYINGSTFVRPPIVRIKMRGLDANNYNKVVNASYNKINLDGVNNDELRALNEGELKLSERDSLVGDLFKYPVSKAYVTKIWDEDTREKRYIVTNVTISKLDDNFGLSYVYDSNDSGISNTFRYGFKVNLTLVETTKNFLDFVPNYYDYLNKESDNLDYNEMEGNPYVTTGNKGDGTKITLEAIKFDTNIDFDTIGIDNNDNNNDSIIYLVEEEKREPLLLKLFKRNSTGQDEYITIVEDVKVKGDYKTFSNAYNIEVKENNSSIDTDESDNQQGGGQQGGQQQAVAKTPLKEPRVSLSLDNNKVLIEIEKPLEQNDVEIKTDLEVKDLIVTNNGSQYNDGTLTKIANQNNKIRYTYSLGKNVSNGLYKISIKQGVIKSVVVNNNNNYITKEKNAEIKAIELEIKKETPIPPEVKIYPFGNNAAKITITVKTEGKGITNNITLKESDIKVTNIRNSKQVRGSLTYQDGYYIYSLGADIETGTYSLQINDGIISVEAKESDKFENGKINSKIGICSIKKEDYKIENKQFDAFDTDLLIVNEGHFWLTPYLPGGNSGATLSAGVDFAPRNNCIANSPNKMTTILRQNLYSIAENRAKLLGNLVVSREEIKTKLDWGGAPNEVLLNYISSKCNATPKKSLFGKGAYYIEKEFSFNNTTKLLTFYIAEGIKNTKYEYDNNGRLIGEYLLPDEAVNLFLEACKTKYDRLDIRIASIKDCFEKLKSGKVYNDKKITKIYTKENLEYFKKDEVKIPSEKDIKANKKWTTLLVDANYHSWNSQFDIVFAALLSGNNELFKKALKKTDVYLERKTRWDNNLAYLG